MCYFKNVTGGFEPFFSEIAYFHKFDADENLFDYITLKLRVHNIYKISPLLYNVRYLVMSNGRFCGGAGISPCSVDSSFVLAQHLLQMTSEDLVT